LASSRKQKQVIFCKHFGLIRQKIKLTFALDLNEREPLRTGRWKRSVGHSPCVSLGCSWLIFNTYIVDCGTGWRTASVAMAQLWSHAAFDVSLDLPRQAAATIKTQKLSSARRRANRKSLHVFSLHSPATNLRRNVQRKIGRQAENILAGCKRASNVFLCTIFPRNLICLGLFYAFLKS